MSTIVIDRAVVEQAMKAMLNFPGDISDEMFESIRALKAAQAEPVQEPVYKVKVTSRWHDTEPLATAFNLPDGEHLLYTAPPKAEPKSLPCPTPKTCREHCCGGWCGPRAEPVQEQAEPLNLSDRAVQKRLAAQWGYVPAERAEPAQEPAAWEASKDGCTIQGVDFTHDVVLRISGDFETDEQRISYAQSVVDALNAAPPKRTMVPLTDEEILAAVGWERAEMYMKLTPNFPVDEAKKETLKNARAVEKASWEKNHG